MTPAGRIMCGTQAEHRRNTCGTVPPLVPPLFRFITRYMSCGYVKKKSKAEHGRSHTKNCAELFRFCSAFVPLLFRFYKYLCCKHLRKKNTQNGTELFRMCSACVPFYNYLCGKHLRKKNTQNGTRSVTHKKLCGTVPLLFRFCSAFINTYAANTCAKKIRKTERNCSACVPPLFRFITICVVNTYAKKTRKTEHGRSHTPPITP